ncbi:hypothetical protein GJ496_004672 [Pomphorhynchus laevis]|nr:hypothetical protein GJ496_004672 [Pomphorhynchus laevis]
MNKSIVFLDTEIYLDSNKQWYTTVHKKFEWVKTLIYAGRSHQPKVKRLEIRNEAIRFNKLCSLENDFIKQIDLIEIELEERGYSR